MRQFIRCFALLASLVAIATLSGCLGALDEKVVVVAPPTVSTKPTAALAPEFHVRPVDKAEYEAVIAGHKGKVVLVDFWATWCEPCKELFPHTVEISKKYKPEQVAVVSLSLDEADDTDAVAAANEFLAAQQATIDNLVSKFEVSESFDQFEIDGAIPHLKLYDRAGKLRHTFQIGPDGPIDPVEVEVHIRELLAE